MTVNKQLTLLLLHCGEKVLLGLKRRGFGAGKWNGFGGKIDAGETVLAAALREMKEESCLDILDAAYVGHIIFEFEAEPEKLEVHVLRGTRYSGEPRETEEMTPAWFDVADVPYASMWADDAHWLPWLLAGKSFEAWFLFRGQTSIVQHEIREVDSWPGVGAEPLNAVLVHSKQSAIDVRLGMPVPVAPDT